MNNIDAAVKALEEVDTDILYTLNFNMVKFN